MIFKPFFQIKDINNPVFLAGPAPRAGLKYSDSCNWREEMIQILQNKGFNGDFIDPVNPDFNKESFEKQVCWEWEGLRIASAIVFWIPRSK